MGGESKDKSISVVGLGNMGSALAGYYRAVFQSWFGIARFQKLQPSLRGAPT